MVGFKRCRSVYEMTIYSSGQETKLIETLQLPGMLFAHDYQLDGLNQAAAHPVATAENDWDRVCFCMG